MSDIAKVVPNGSSWKKPMTKQNKHDAKPPSAEAMQVYTGSNGGPTCAYNKVPTCPAHELFENPEVVTVVTDSMMRVGRKLLGPADRGMVRDTVAANFRKISVHLHG